MNGDVPDFEALLRRKSVTCYGLPFYAGWGLTIDKIPCERRQRRLSLEELVAGALILYPNYLDPVSNLPCTPEVVLERIDEIKRRNEAAPPLVQMRRKWGQMRKLGRRLIGN